MHHEIFTEKMGFLKEAGLDTEDTRLSMNWYTLRK